MKVKAQTMRVFDCKDRLIRKDPLSKQRTFKIIINVIERQCLLSWIDDDNGMWHQRFGHLYFRDLRMLNEKKMVKGLPQVNLPSKIYVKCCTGKQSRTSYKVEVLFKATMKLEVIYSDVCGPFEVKLLGGNSYFVSSIDKLI